MDVVIGNEQLRQTRLWSPQSRQVDRRRLSGRAGRGRQRRRARRSAVHASAWCTPTASASLIVRNEQRRSGLALRWQRVGRATRACWPASSSTASRSSPARDGRDHGRSAARPRWRRPLRTDRRRIRRSGPSSRFEPATGLDEAAVRAAGRDERSSTPRVATRACASSTSTRTATTTSSSRTRRAIRRHLFDSPEKGWSQQLARRQAGRRAARFP